MVPLRVAVIGAGIAGLTVAAALSRQGIRCEVFEQTRHLREIGAGIQLAPNATRVLRGLGLGDFLGVVAVRPEAIEMRRWDDNQVVARTTLGKECEELYGDPYYTAHRADLHRGLLELLPAGTVHLGRRCIGIEENTDEVVLRFADGFTTTADVVIGADGIHSAVREVLLADSPEFSGQTIYRGLVPADRLPFLLTEPKVVLWLGPEQHGVCYPVSAGKLISFGATTPAADWRTESWTAQGSVTELAGQYAGWNPEFQQVLSAAEAVNRWALHDRGALTTWSTDRVTVVGDAAHPMLPFMAQGANQAIEDAIALAGFLRGATPDSTGAALKQYEELRNPRTRDIQQNSRANAKVLHLPDGEEQRERDSELIGRANLRNQAWLYEYDVERITAEIVNGRS
ncbi:FAD-dependent monooxygenase [Amycolatopsis roodepoortensis]|uniref:FAD-dependent monooxygenase n=1 Tax=Amycolatopsis roodepoortensis TaxID=700274 RepID=UPI00214C8F63|nr:FAD-dependent monooxygenase [Amycolatopsis roodepoortensis]UUV31547.1 FAD-dependent monooxygenase [Amycolatopsis roodepoortensis]